MIDPYQQKICIARHDKDKDENETECAFLAMYGCAWAQHEQAARRNSRHKQNGYQQKLSSSVFWPDTERRCSPNRECFLISGARGLGGVDHVLSAVGPVNFDVPVAVSTSAVWNVRMRGRDVTGRDPSLASTFFHALERLDQRGHRAFGLDMGLTLVRENRI